MPEQKKEETKAQKFTRIAPGRMDKALAAIDKIVPLAGPNYENTKDQGESIVKALKARVALVEKAFKGEEVASGGFTFD